MIFATQFKLYLSKWLTRSNYKMSYESLKEMFPVEELKETMSSKLIVLLVQNGSEKLEDTLKMAERDQMAQT